MKFRVMALAMVSVMAISSTSFAAASQPQAQSPLQGTINEPQWINSENLIVKKVTDQGFEYYKLGLNGSSELLLKAAANATELVMSPDGKQFVYVNDNGDLFLVDSATKVESKISTDTEPKMELQFSDNGSKLYYLLGDKIDRVAAVNLADRKQSIVVDDKVSYKSDLQISKDETKALYAVSKSGKVDEVAEAYTVDSKGTEPQYNLADLKTAAAKPVQLTSTPDNKIYGSFLLDNRMVFVSASSDDTGMPLKQISADGKDIKFLVNHLDVSESVVLKDGSLLIIGENSAFKKSVFTVDASGTTKQLAVLPEGTLAISATDVNHIAATVETELGEKVSILTNGKFTDLSK
jgi:Tol biopolymer transport system component